MPPTGKEIERQIETSEAIALKEVEGYIEKVEKSTEVSGQDSQNNQGNPKYSSGDIGAIAPKTQTQTVVPDVKNIVLPLTEQSITDGLKGSIYSGIKWLSEWCVMMIKKYPGRVFYSPPTQGYD